MDAQHDELEGAIAFSVQLSQLQQGLAFNLRLNSQAHQMAAAYFAIAVDHREGLLLLVRAGAYSPAFALVRSIYEALMRGTWAYFCAPEDQCKHAYKTGVLPKFDTIVQRLDKLEKSKGVFGRSRDLAWASYCDFAHGLMRQVTRWIAPDAIRPQHNPEEVADLLTIADAHYLQALIAMAWIAEQPRDGMQAAQEELLRRFRERKAGKAQESPGSAD
jgi:hypothetical protein